MPPTRPKKGLPFLFVALLLLYGLYPVIRPGEASGIFVNLFLSAMFVAGVYAAGARRRRLFIMLALGLPALILTWVYHARPSLPLAVATVVVSMVFLAYMIYLLLRSINRADRVTSDVIYGAACAYLLIGLFWAFAYMLVVALEPRAFDAPNVRALIEAGRQLRMVGVTSFLYYSIVTLTTLGYGDIVPVAPIAQTLSSLEAIVGQLYLAILLGRVVGMYVAHETAARMSKPAGVPAEEERIQ